MKYIFYGIFAGTLLTLAGCHCDKCSCCKEHAKHYGEEQHNQAPEKKALSESQESVIEIKSITEFNEKVLNATRPVVVDFYTTWCGACKMMAPVFTEIARELQAHYLFVKVDAEQVAELSSKYNVRGYPTFIIFKKL